MHIFIDESGSFIPGSPIDSWCVVAAYVVPERSRKKVEDVLVRTKKEVCGTVIGECKLKEFKEAQLLRFLNKLAEMEGVLYCSATDPGRQSKDDVSSHLAGQVSGIVKHKDKMIHEKARLGIQQLADRFATLSPQLYLQLATQWDLVFNLIGSACLYFVQRNPAALGHFRWRTDEKNEGKSLFEESFRDLAAPMNQAKSIDNPYMALIGADYSHFERFRLVGGVPSYLNDVYGLNVKDGFDIKKVMREDFKFVESSAVIGVQIVDLLASGLRRCLRLEFDDNDGIAAALGSLMVQRQVNEVPISLMSLKINAGTVGSAERPVFIFRNNQRQMLL
jgi:uncharacterized protein DUF3800